MTSDLSSWDTYFYEDCPHVARKSKDPSRKIGAIATRDNLTVLTGFNGFPRGVNDTIAERYSKQFKNLHTVHAEANLVSLAAGEGISLKGTTVYCSLHPCLPCANLMIQAKVARVVCPKMVIEPEGEEIYWFQLSREVMLEAGIQITEVSNEDGRLTSTQSG